MSPVVVEALQRHAFGLAGIDPARHLGIHEVRHPFGEDRRVPQGQHQEAEALTRTLSGDRGWVKGGRWRISR